MNDDIHEIFAVYYGRHDRKAAENYLFGDAHDVLDPLNYFVWVIAGTHGSFVVDTGFDQTMAKKRQRHVEKPIGEGLTALGIRPDSVKDVIVTHLHYDHTGNYELFPNARYHLQDTEMAYATGRCMCHQVMRVPFEEEDVVAMVRKVFAGRVCFHDGESQVAPGITVHKIGGHSKGLQCVRVKTKRGPVVLASDATHLYSHFEGGRVFPITYNVAEVLEGYATMKRLAASVNHVIPGHDPQVMQRYPAAKPGLEGWVARLDVEPNVRTN